MLIDTHCHLNDPEAFPNPKVAVEEARATGVEALIVVGVDVESSRRALQIAESMERVFAIVGWHPNYASGYTRAAIPEIESMLTHPKAVALGEIGLDLHWQYATLDQQMDALQDQLDLAEQCDAPVVFHCREAYGQLLEVLEARSPRPYLFHCFSGSERDADRAIALGAYFGIDGPITYKKSAALRELAATLPRDRIVLETDSPYLSPEPHRGKPNRPANLPLICAALAQSLDIADEECRRVTGDNAGRFFRLPD